MTLGLIKAILALIALSIAHAILVSGVQAASKESPRKQAARAAAPSHRRRSIAAASITSPHFQTSRAAGLCRPTTPASAG